MFTIDIDVDKKPGIIELGRQGDNLADGADFDISSWVDEYGSGAVYIYHQRAGDPAPYFRELPVSTTGNKSTATWAFDSTDTGVQGSGMAQLLYVKDNIIKKTATYVTVTEKSLGDASGDVPDPYDDLLEQVRAIYENMAVQRQAAAGSASLASASAAEASQSANAAASSASEAQTYAAQAGSVFSQVGNVAFVVNEDASVTAIFTKEG